MVVIATKNVSTKTMKNALIPVTWFIACNLVFVTNKAENTVQNQSIIQMVRVMVFNATFISCSVIV
jgi:hypothetical protein